MSAVVSATDCQYICPSLNIFADGRRVGILSRGYGGVATGEPRFVTRDSEPREMGDEAVLLAQSSPARVCVCADRVAGARHLIAEADVDVIVCDDGLQHYRLERDVEIAVVDGMRDLVWALLNTKEFLLIK